MVCVCKIRGLVGRAISLPGGIAIAIATFLSLPAIALTNPLAPESSEPIERDFPSERLDLPAPALPETESLALADADNLDRSLATDSLAQPDSDDSDLFPGERDAPTPLSQDKKLSDPERKTDTTHTDKDNSDPERKTDTTNANRDNADEDNLDIAQSISPQEVQPLPELPPDPPDPPAEPNLSTPTPPDEAIPENCPENIIVEKFVFEGNSTFSQEELAAATRSFLNRPLACLELLAAFRAVTTLYRKNDYETSGVKNARFLKATQQSDRRTVVIQVLEGELEKIEVQMKGRLNPGYVRSRLRLAASRPLNTRRLEAGLQLLQLDPLIDTIRARLSAGTAPGTTILDVEVKAARSFDPQLSIDNSRVPSVGSIQRRLALREANLLGLGDGIGLTYSNSDGSNRFDIEYTVPLNPRNGTLRFSYGKTNSRVIEAPFDVLDIRSASLYTDVSFRQPISRTVRQDPFEFQEFVLGLTVSRRESESFLLGIPFPLSFGADDNGRSRITAIRFSQEWTRQTPKEVLALRSQVSLGTGLFGATINKPIPGLEVTLPDSRFLSWQGQAQWVRILAPDTVFLARANAQLADRPLLSLEQFALGGFGSVRGYRQDSVVADNGVFASLEFWLPILRSQKSQTLIQLIPFIDAGKGWNSGGNPGPETNTLASVGLGLQWRQSNKLSARLEWGIPLIAVESRDRTLQEQGLYFSLQVNPF